MDEIFNEMKTDLICKFSRINFPNYHVKHLIFLLMTQKDDARISECPFNYYVCNDMYLFLMVIGISDGGPSSLSEACKGNLQSGPKSVTSDFDEDPFAESPNEGMIKKAFFVAKGYIM